MANFKDLDRSTQINLRRLYDDEPKNVPAKVINAALKAQTTYRLLGGSVLAPQTLALIIAENDPKMGVPVEASTESKTDSKGSK